VVVTWPPSARYSPQLHANRTLGPQDPSSVWAVLLPVLESPQQPTVEVSFVLHCGRAELDLSMEHRQGRLWVGRLSGVPGAFCSGTIAHIQVKASDGSCSELRPVTVGRRGDSLEFVQPQAYMPLDLSWVDWGRSIALRVDWPYWGYSNGKRGGGLQVRLTPRRPGRCLRCGGSCSSGSCVCRVWR